MLVTGAGSGIGRDIALRFVQLGAHVHGLGRRAEALAETNELASGLAGRFSYASVDVRAVDDARQAVGAFADEGLDTLINNAGGQFYAPASGISDRGFRAVVELNLNALFTVTMAAHAGLAREGGSIVNMSLSGVDRGGVGMAHSIAARAGVLGLTRTLALEWAHESIRINCIGPGVVATPGLAPELTANLDAIVAETVPAGRATSTRDIAETVAFLTSDAGRMITGQLLQVDGGAHLGRGLHAIDDWPPAAP